MLRDRRFWTTAITEFERSGLTQEAFAARRGVSVGTLRGWIYRLRQERKASVSLVPVRVIASTAPAARRPGARRAARGPRRVRVRPVVTMGATALRALNRIERHGLVLKQAAGHLHSWQGRKLLPLYHAGLLGRVSRNEAAQRADMAQLAEPTTLLIRPSGCAQRA